MSKGADELCAVEVLKPDLTGLEMVVGLYERIDALQDDAVRRACLQTIEFVENPLMKYAPEPATDLLHRGPV